MGGVLVVFDPDLFLKRYEINEDEKQLLKNEVFGSVEWVMLDRGTITYKDAFGRIKKRLPEQLHEVAWDLMVRWDQPLILMPGMEELIEDLNRSGYGIYLLSNASIRQPEYWKRIPASRFFTDVMISCNYKLLKPDPEIFHTAYAKFGIKPEESLFIDDNPGNVESAVFTGMDGFIFRGETDDLRRWLIHQGVKMKPIRSIVIGSPGSGKSTFARKLRDKTGLPLYYKNGA